MTTPAPASPVPCANCFYKETAGQMVDPCFPCLLGQDFCGQPKPQYDYWVHDSTTWEEVERRQEELFKAFDQMIAEDPELRAELERLFGPIEPRES